MVCRGGCSGGVDSIGSDNSKYDKDEKKRHQLGDGEEGFEFALGQ